MTAIVRYISSIIERVTHLCHRNYDSVIFLDFDGVLSPITDEEEVARDYYGVLFNSECTQNLNSLIETTNAKIVVSSSWRQYLSLWKLRMMWRRRNMLGEIVDVTPVMSIHRGNEIDAWLRRNRPMCYVIIDDMDSRQFCEHHAHHLVTCNGRVGLTKTDVQNAITKLTK